MAGLQERGGSYRVFFRFRGKQQTFPLGKVSKREADAKSAQIDYLLLRLKQRLIDLPPGVAITDVLQHDGKPPDSAVAAPCGNAGLVTLRDQFLSMHAGVQKKDALHTARIVKHLIATLGEQSFQTRAEVARKIAGGGLTDDQKTELWESLYLTADEVSAFVRSVSEAARHPFIYSMVCMAAHTGARRKELIRADVSDVDFDSQVVTIREKKWVRGQQTSRRVSLSPFLAGVLKDWLPVPSIRAATTCSAIPMKWGGARSEAAPPAT